MRFRFALLLVPAAVVLCVAGACSDEGEGQVCDHNNGNNDCQSGLVCTVNIPGVNGDRCCPVDRSTSTVPECAGTPSLADASPAPPDGTTPLPEAAADAPATTDGPRESSVTDAPAEAMPADAGADGADGEAGVVRDAAAPDAADQ